MNHYDARILRQILENGYDGQCRLAEDAGLSVGLVNKSLSVLRSDGFLSADYAPTESAVALAAARRPRRAVILAAGFGMRMVPINLETPKALIEVRGEALIERQIRQLQEAEIRDITVAVGFMKERFEYLMDAYGVNLVVNPDYAVKNNLSSLYRVRDRLENCYIVPCDLWAEENPFRRTETESWYLMSNATDGDSSVRVNRKGEIVARRGDQPGNRMIGIAYLTGKTPTTVRKRLEDMSRDRRYDECFWEETLWEGDRFVTDVRTVPDGTVIEINTYEQLREMDSGSASLDHQAIDAIRGALGVQNSDIRDITVLKKGMTNRSFLFTCKGKRYITRIPGEGTDQLINREQEYEVYETLKGLEICDPVVFMDHRTGIKITEFMEGARNCDPMNPEEVRRCMARLREFHGKGLKVDHTFDIFGQIEYYESLWDGAESVFRDYRKTKQAIFALRPLLEKNAKPWTLTHIDAVPDNFLFVPDGKGGEQIRLIDWEYAGMQDPDTDIAMFCIYSLYDREHVEQTVDAYYPEGCDEGTRTKIYALIATCGLLWSNWCEYKRSLGVEFGEYALRQYRYAKDYERLVRERITKEEG